MVLRLIPFSARQYNLYCWLVYVTYRLSISDVGGWTDVLEGGYIWSIIGGHEIHYVYSVSLLKDVVNHYWLCCILHVYYVLVSWPLAHRRSKSRVNVGSFESRCAATEFDVCAEYCSVSD